MQNFKSGEKKKENEENLFNPIEGKKRKQQQQWQ